MCSRAESKHVDAQILVKSVVGCIKTPGVRATKGVRADGRARHSSRSHAPLHFSARLVAAKSGERTHFKIGVEFNRATEPLKSRHDRSSVVGRPATQDIQHAGHAKMGIWARSLCGIQDCPRERSISECGCCVPRRAVSLASRRARRHRLGDRAAAMTDDRFCSACLLARLQASISRRRRHHPHRPSSRRRP